jgi:hypothetical protein
MLKLVLVVVGKEQTKNGWASTGTKNVAGTQKNKQKKCFELFFHC